MAWWEDVLTRSQSDESVKLPETIAPEMGDWSLGGGTPAISGALTVPRSEGISVSGILGTIEKTAQTGFDIFSKVYALQDSVEAAKVNRQLNQSRVQLQTAQAAGAIDVGLARAQADVAIEKIRAQAAVANAQAQASSGATGFTRQGVDLSKLVPFAVIGFVIWKALKGGDK